MDIALAALTLCQIVDVGHATISGLNCLIDDTESKRESTMNEAEFLAQAEDTLMALEDAIDECDAALDFESSSGVLTIDCEDSNTQVIVSRQLAMQQIWVAAKSGGFHCDWEGSQWTCTTTGESLDELLNRVLSEQSSQPVAL